MNMNKWRRRFRIYRDYFVGFGFIASILLLALTIDLVKALSSKPAETEVISTSSSESVEINPENLVSGYSLSLMLLSNDDSMDDNKLIAGYSLALSQLSRDTFSVVQNDNEIVSASYETDTSGKDKEDSKDNDADKATSKSKSEPESSSYVPEYDEELEYNLAKLIDAEGSILDDYCQQLIAYCFLNRMRSNHWKNTFDGVLNDGIGYHPRTCEYVASSDNIPSEKALKNAKICLKNHYANTMPVPYNLVFQAGFKQGTVYYYDEEHGVYFCLADKLQNE